MVAKVYNCSRFKDIVLNERLKSQTQGSRSYNANKTLNVMRMTEPSTRQVFFTSCNRRRHNVTFTIKHQFHKIVFWFARFHYQMSSPSCTFIKCSRPNVLWDKIEKYRKKSNGKKCCLNGFFLFVWYNVCLLVQIEDRIHERKQKRFISMHFNQEYVIHECV